jgi:hypothetical protein
VRLCFTGVGASPQGNRPFIDVWDLDTKEKDRIWQSEAPYYEYPTGAIMSDPYESNHIRLDGLQLSTLRESPKDIPQFCIRTFHEVR